MATLIQPSAQLVDLSRLETAFIAVHIIGGHIGIPLLVLTFLLSKRVHTHPTLVNFCCSWILYSVAFCMLAYAGQQNSTEPDFALCLIQAAMVHGVVPMTVLAGLFVVIQVWSTFQERPIPFFPNLRPWMRTVLFILPPYIAFFGFAIPFGMYGLAEPEMLSIGHGIYCTIEDTSLRPYIVPAFALVTLALILIFQMAIFWNYFTRWRNIKQVCPLVERSTSLSLTLRVAFFSIYSVIAAGIAVVLLTSNSSAMPYMLQATLPLAVFLVFASQKDVVLSWCFWRRNEDPTVAHVVDLPPRKMSATSHAYPCTPESPDFDLEKMVHPDDHKYPEEVRFSEV